MILVGCVAQARRTEAPDGLRRPSGLFAFLRQHYICPTGLFLDQATGARRRLARLSRPIRYLTLACYRYAEWSGNERALALANACTRKLLELQVRRESGHGSSIRPEGGSLIFTRSIRSINRVCARVLRVRRTARCRGATDALVKG